MGTLHCINEVDPLFTLATLRTEGMAVIKRWQYCRERFEQESRSCCGEGAIKGGLALI